MAGEAVEESPDESTTETRALMAFIRENELVAAKDLGLWFFSGNAEELLEAFVISRGWCKPPERA